MNKITLTLAGLAIGIGALFGSGLASAHAEPNRCGQWQTCYTVEVDGRAFDVPLCSDPAATHPCVLPAASGQLYWTD